MLNSSSLAVEMNEPLFIFGFGHSSSTEDLLMSVG